MMLKELMPSNFLKICSLNHRFIISDLIKVRVVYRLYFWCIVVQSFFKNYSNSVSVSRGASNLIIGGQSRGNLAENQLLYLPNLMFMSDNGKFSFILFISDVFKLQKIVETKAIVHERYLCLRTTNRIYVMCVRVCLTKSFLAIQMLS